MVRSVTEARRKTDEQNSAPSTGDAAPRTRRRRIGQLDLLEAVHMVRRLLESGELSQARELLDRICALAPLGVGGGQPFTLVDRQQVSRDAVKRPVEILTLGGFDIHIDGSAFAGGIKPQRRPLDLLKLLVLCGDVPMGAGELADRLWPDSDGDTARNCLQVAVYRLRRLLGHEEAVLVHDRKLRLNPLACRVDLWEFERAVAELTGVPAGTAAFATLAQHALALYRGHLFSHEPDHAWMLAPRERLRRTWLDLVRQLGRHYEMMAQLPAAQALYQRAIELDPLAEEIYRRLMLCQHTMGERTEALCTYRRCCKQLTAVLGVEPSPDTARLYRVLSRAAS
jgi:DNA-binding SARP family transcriptional activator